jgi:hypothetical protein
MTNIDMDDMDTDDSFIFEDDAARLGAAGVVLLDDDSDDDFDDPDDVSDDDPDDVSGDDTDDVSDDDPDDDPDDVSDDDPDDVSDDDPDDDPDDVSDDDPDDDSDDDGVTQEQALKVAFLYEAALDRNGEIDEDGLSFWIRRFEDGADLDDIAEAFIDSLEFEESFGDPDDMDDEEFLTTCYGNILDRGPDPNGFAFWLGQLGEDDFGRDDLVVAFAVSLEKTEGTVFSGELTEVSEGEWAFV